jgi:hypothetical protein
MSYLFHIHTALAAVDATFSLTKVVYLLLAVAAGLLICYCVALFISDAKIMQIVRLIVGICVLIFGLRLFGVAA